MIAPTAAASASTYDDTDGEMAAPPAVAPGEPFEVYVDGEADVVTDITLTVSNPDVPDSAIEIAGEQSLEKDADAEGDATFTVTLSAEGEYSLVATDQNGNEIDSSVVVVVGAAADDDDDADDGAADDDSAAGGAALPDTGAPVGPIAAGAAALLVAGGGAMLFARRRQAQLG